jgi:hypothetical protein
VNPVDAIDSGTLDTIALLVAELVTEVRGLRSDLRRDRPVSTLSRDDRALLARVLPAIAGARGSEPFASRDLAEDVPALRVVLRGLSVKSIGRLLSRAKGIPIDGWIVERYGTEINVVLWRVLGSVSSVSNR